MLRSLNVTFNDRLLQLLLRDVVVVDVGLVVLLVMELHDLGRDDRLQSWKQNETGLKTGFTSGSSDYIIKIWHDCLFKIDSSKAKK